MLVCVAGRVLCCCVGVGVVEFKAELGFEGADCSLDELPERAWEFFAGRAFSFFAAGRIRVVPAL